MSTKREIDRLFAYGDWANRETLASLRDGVPVGALRRMAHILGAERTWFQRLTGGPPVEVWPGLGVEACKAELEDLRRRWHGLLATLSDEGLQRKVSYVNTKGKRLESTVGEILMHVALHGAYHRGQVAADVRAAGRDPAYTDYIHATRERIV